MGLRSLTVNLIDDIVPKVVVFNVVKKGDC